MIYLYTLLAIALISLPVAFAYWGAIKRGKSTRTTARFVLPYIWLLSLGFFWIEDVRGLALLIWMASVVAFSGLAFYAYTKVLDVGHGFREK